MVTCTQSDWWGRELYGSDLHWWTKDHIGLKREPWQTIFLLRYLEIRFEGVFTFTGQTHAWMDARLSVPICAKTGLWARKRISSLPSLLWVHRVCLNPLWMDFLSSSSLLSSTQTQTPQVIAYTFAMVCELCWDSSPFDSHKDGWLTEVLNNRFGLGFSSFCNRFGALILWQVERSISWLTVATSGLMTPRFCKSHIICMFMHRSRKDCSQTQFGAPLVLALLIKVWVHPEQSFYRISPKV